jgi:hypothetical protein
MLPARFLIALFATPLLRLGIAERANSQERPSKSVAITGVETAKGGVTPTRFIHRASGCQTLNRYRRSGGRR